MNQSQAIGGAMSAIAAIGSAACKLRQACHRMLVLKEYSLDGDKKREDMREGGKD